MENNTPDQPLLNQYDDEIDLRELFAVLWAGKLKIIAITAIFAVASVIYALSIPNQYKWPFWRFRPVGWACVLSRR